MSRLEQHYQNVIIHDLIETFEYENVSQLPSIDKIIINCGFKSIKFNDKLIYPILIAFESLTGQRPVVTRAKKDNSNLKIRSGTMSGVKVTLRKEKMYDFLEQLVLTILPRIKYFEGFSTKSVTHDGHFSLRIHNPLDCLLFETEFEKFQTLGPIDVTIVTKNSTHEESLTLLTGFQLPLLVNEEEDDE